MSNISKYNLIVSLLAFIAFNSIAEDGWLKRETNMQCGPALVKVSAECKVNPRDTTSNICKNYNISITKGDKKFSHSLPYIPETQRKLLEKQGYKFNEIIEGGDWVPQTMSCYDDESMIISYTTGMNDQETVSGSLTSNTHAPFFDLNGNFTSDEKNKELRLHEMRGDNNYTYINFIEK
ncbi:hypothetical protein C9426_33980 [Serratia sp. S1B]|nr:hypothetical protein C9426_33980 [Serratia sp. S1B]